MHKKIRDVTFSWEGGRYFDLWMVVHTLSGVFIGFLLAFLVFPIYTAYALALIALIFWELFEKYILNIYESKDNRVIDVVVGMMGFAVAFQWSLNLDYSSVTSLLTFSSIVLICLTLIGWLDFRRRRLERLKKIK